MKKLFLTLCLLATSVATWADLWTAPSSNVYPNETPLYVTVNIDEEAATYVPEITEIAAFIDGQCRAHAIQKTGNFYILRVRGGDADQGKAITIKALYNGLVYKFNRTETFDGEADTHDVPLVLQLQPLLGITLDESPIEMVLNGTYNLAEHLTYQYGTDGMPTSVSPIDQDETPLTVSYSAGNYVSYFTVDETGVLTAKSVGRGEVTVDVTGPAFENVTASFSASAGVIVSLPTVTQIVVNPTELTVYVGDNLQSLIREGKLSISMLPAEADQGYRFSSNEPTMPWNANYMFTTAGDYEVFVYSTANGDLAPVTLTIHVKEPLSFQLEEDAYVNEIGMIQPKTFNIYMNTNDGFDPSLLTIQSYGKTAIAPFAYELSDLQQEEMSPEGGAGRYYVTVTMTGRYVGPATYEIFYNGEPIADVFNDAQVLPEIALNSGWQWVSPYAFEEGSEVGNFCIDGNYQAWVTNDIIEMRTQEGLLYVDSKLGAFGDITQFNFTEGMYKVKSKSKRVLRLATDQNSWQLAQYNDGNSMSNGYNWVVYPYEFPLTMDEASGSLVDYAQEGDQIISKDGTFAEFNNGEWVHNGFTFQPGAGYMYYYNGADDVPFEIYFNIYENTPACYSDAAPVKGEMGSMNKMEPVWSINRSKFADNMTIVAEVEGLTNAEDWVLGAFVGDECRGEGRAVRDGIMFIGIAGKNGEKMNFRLHNTRTGEEFDVTESLKFQQKAGSMKAPLRLTSEGATGISSLSDKAKANDNAIYDLSGRRVERPAKGIYVVNGKKVLF